MAISATKGSWSLQEPLGGVPLAPAFHIASYKITAPADTGVTGFAVTIPGLTTNSRIIGLVPTSSTAAALVNWYAVCATDTLTIYFDSANPAATNTWDVTIGTQV